MESKAKVCPKIKLLISQHEINDLKNSSFSIPSMNSIQRISPCPTQPLLERFTEIHRQIIISISCRGIPKLGSTGIPIQAIVMCYLWSSEKKKWTHLDRTEVSKSDDNITFAKKLQISSDLPGTKLK